MRKPAPILVAISVLFLVSLACAAPTLPAPTQDVNVLGTAIMATMASGATQTAAAVVPPSATVMSPTPWPTFTPVPPLATFTPSASPSATSSPTATATSTSLVPLISVSVPTNCRTGPGKIYDRVGALLVGEVAEVVGRNATGNYWYIRNPRQPNGFCWLWGEYATLSGNLSALPVYTPPPTPTPAPNFQAFYDGKETCSGWWVDIELENTGGVAFRSVSMTLRDTDTDVVLTLYTDGFTNKDGCLDSNTRDNLNPGGSRIISSPAFSYDPAGHDLRATITLCSNLGQNGMCVTKVIEFRP